MPLPVAHTLLGAGVVAALLPRRGAETGRGQLAFGAFLGILPDFDYCLNFAPGLGGGWHHGFTHSFAFSLLAGLLASAAAGRPGVRGALAYGSATLSHPLLDYLCTESWGRGTHLAPLGSEVQVGAAEADRLRGPALPAGPRLGEGRLPGDGVRATACEPAGVLRVRAAPRARPVARPTSSVALRGAAYCACAQAHPPSPPPSPPELGSFRKIVIAPGPEIRARPSSFVGLRINRRGL